MQEEEGRKAERAKALPERSPHHLERTGGRVNARLEGVESPSTSESIERMRRGGSWGCRGLMLHQPVSHLHGDDAFV